MTAREELIRRIANADPHVPAACVPVVADAALGWFQDLIAEAQAIQAARVEHPAEEMLVCERMIGHPGMCMRRCKKMPGCTEPVDHRKHCTTGTFRGIDWADSAITRCPGRGR